MEPNRFDHLERRCPRLGHSIHFAYCRVCEADARPCFKLLDCWWESFDVAAYCRETCSQEEVARLADPHPHDKVASLLELIEQARRRTAGES